VISLGLKMPIKKTTGDGRATKAKREKRLGQIAPSPMSAKVTSRPAINVSRTDNEPSRLGSAADTGEALILWRLTFAFCRAACAA